MDLDPNLDIFKLEGETVVRRVESVPSLPGGPTRAFVMISSSKLLQRGGLLGWSKQGVMDATFKVEYLCGCYIDFYNSSSMDVI